MIVATTTATTTYTHHHVINYNKIPGRSSSLPYRIKFTLPLPSLLFVALKRLNPILEEPVTRLSNTSFISRRGFNMWIIITQNSIRTIMFSDVLSKENEVPFPSLLSRLNTATHTHSLIFPACF